MAALQPVALRHRRRERSRSLRRRVWSSAAPRHSQIVLRPEQFRTRFGKLRFRIFHVQLEQRLSLLDWLSLHNANLLDKRVQLRAHRERRNRLNLSVAGDRSDNIFANRSHRGNFHHRLAATRLDQHQRQHAREQQEGQYAVTKSAIHFPFVASSLSHRRARTHSRRMALRPRCVACWPAVRWASKKLIVAIRLRLSLTTFCAFGCLKMDAVSATLGCRMDPKWRSAWVLRTLRQPNLAP